MKPFLHLAIREDDAAAAAEFEAIASFGRLGDGELVQIRTEQGPLPAIDPGEYSGVIIGGGELNTSDDDKSAVQERVEADLGWVLDLATEHGIPVLGLCYGLGIVTQHFGGLVDKTFGEPPGAVEVTLTDDGAADPLFAGIPPLFLAFVSHKEACREMPEGAVLLAGGQACPVQAYRVGGNVWVTQFHPELDAERLVERMVIYAHAGYFRPEELPQLSAEARAAGVGPEPGLILANFVTQFRS